MNNFLVTQRRTLCGCLSLAVLLAMVGDLLAWNKAGHMVAGALAYRELKNSSPNVLSKTLEILRKHPHFEERWTPRLALVNDQADKDMYLFMLAARWPDDIRGDPDFDTPEWHYVNFPFRPPSDRTRKPRGNDILDGIEENSRIIKDNNQAEEDRAVALCWIFHLVGDIHQPLHSSALFNARFPQGDRGGTKFYVRVSPESGTYSLHKLWDEMIIKSDRFQGVRNTASELANREHLQRTALPELGEMSPDTWARIESFKAAREIAYNNGELRGSTDDDEGAVLPAGYLDRAKPVAERRMALAGYRLSDLLKELVEE